MIRHGRLRWTGRSNPAIWLRFAAFRLLLAAGILFAQLGAQLHAIEHIDHDLAVAKFGSKKAPPLKHTAEQCSLYAALDSGISGSSLPVLCLPQGIETVAVTSAGIVVFTLAPFRSRAPPATLS